MKMVKFQILVWLTLPRKLGEGGVVTMEGSEDTYRFVFYYRCFRKKRRWSGTCWRRLARGEKILKRNLYFHPSQMSQAVEVIMEKEAVINASAKEDGPGGTVVLWSDIKMLIQ